MTSFTIYLRGLMGDIVVNDGMKVEIGRGRHGAGTPPSSRATPVGCGRGLGFALFVDAEDQRLVRTD